MALKLWHCKDTRSLRPLWAMEEMGLEYELHMLPFPPRFLQREFLDINPLGTVPYFEDGEQSMTESVAICHYLVETYSEKELAIAPGHADYADYLNWLYHSDATLTFPQTIYLRYSQLEPEERRLPQAAEDYRKWFLARLRKLDAHIATREYLCGGRFTIADIAVGFALYLGEQLGIAGDYASPAQAYLQRLKSRPAFVRAAGRDG